MSTQKPPPLPMLPWWPGDYLGATRGFSLAERGAYTDLLFFSWLNGPLPNDPALLARMIGVPPKQFLAIWSRISGKFTATAGGLVNERLERERRGSLTRRAKAAEKAQAAAGARWAEQRRRQSEDARSNAPSMPIDATRDAPSNAPSMNSAPQRAMLGAMHEECPPASASASSPNTHKSEEGGRAAHTPAGAVNGKPKAIALDAHQRIHTVLKDKTCSSWRDSDIAKAANVTVEEVRRVRAAQ